MPSLLIRPLKTEDIQSITGALCALGWSRSVSQNQQYVAEQEGGKRDALVANVEGYFAAYVTILWESTYSPFSEQGIPEIVDLNVLPQFRRQGVATALLAAAEGRIGRRSSLAGIAVGMDADYGAAQRLSARSAWQYS